MKQRFVLDENILHLAESGTNERGEKDLSSTRLLDEIAKRCHATAVDDAIFRKYMQKAAGFPRVISLLSQMWRDQRKFIYCQHVPAAPHEDQLPRKDVLFVRVAILTQALLVTTDQPLIDSFVKLSIPPESSFAIIRPEAAVPYALEECP